MGGRDGVVMMVGGWVGIVVYGCSNLDLLVNKLAEKEGFFAKKKFPRTYGGPG